MLLLQVDRYSKDYHTCINGVLLFVIRMEALSCLINRAGKEGGVFLSGCRIRGRIGDGAQITSLLFADFTLVFCEAS